MRARAGRDRNLKRAIRAMAQLEMFSVLVAKYERSLRGVLPPGPAPKIKPRTNWLDAALDSTAKKKGS